MTNIRTSAEIRDALDSIVDELKALDAATIDGASIVPLARVVRDVGTYAATLDAQIRLRVLTNGGALPGVAVKPGVSHRKWNDEAIAAELAFAQFGLRAFKFVSPAAIEKLGDEGEALVAVASYKPAADDRVVY